MHFVLVEGSNPPVSSGMLNQPNGPRGCAALFVDPNFMLGDAIGSDHQNSLNDLDSDEEVSKFKSPGFGSF